FGSALASGDFNGDGFSDLAIGIPGEDLVINGTTFTDTGRLVVIYGSANGLTATDTTVPHPQSFEYRDFPGNNQRGDEEFGDALAWGDFNGDGVGDLAIGIPGTSDSLGAQNVGAVRVIFG